MNEIKVSVIEFKLEDEYNIVTKSQIDGSVPETWFFDGIRIPPRSRVIRLNDIEEAIKYKYGQEDFKFDLDKLEDTASKYDIVFKFGLRGRKGVVENYRDTLLIKLKEADDNLTLVHELMHFCSDKWEPEKFQFVGNPVTEAAVETATELALELDKWLPEKIQAASVRGTIRRYSLRNLECLEEATSRHEHLGYHYFYQEIKEAIKRKNDPS